MKQTLGPRKIALMLGVPMPTLHAWSETGVGPMPVRRGRYLRSEVELWAAEMRAAASAPIKDCPPA